MAITELTLTLLGNQVNTNTLQDIQIYVRHRRALEGDEGEDVDRAHAGVIPLVRGEVDELHGLFREGESGVLDGAGLPGERDHAAVVVGIERDVEDGRSGGAGGGGQGLDELRPAAFAEVGDAFEDHVRDSRVPGGERKGPD